MRKAFLFFFSFLTYPSSSSSSSSSSFFFLQKAYGRCAVGVRKARGRQPECAKGARQVCGWRAELRGRCAEGVKNVRICAVVCGRFAEAWRGCAKGARLVLSFSLFFPLHVFFFFFFLLLLLFFFFFFLLRFILFLLLSSEGGRARAEGEWRYADACGRRMECAEGVRNARGSFAGFAECAESAPIARKVCGGRAESARKVCGGGAEGVPLFLLSLLILLCSFPVIRLLYSGEASRKVCGRRVEDVRNVRKLCGIRLGCADVRGRCAAGVLFFFFPSFLSFFFFLSLFLVPFSASSFFFFLPFLFYLLSSGCDRACAECAEIAWKA